MERMKQGLVPHLTVKGGVKAIEFYKKALGARLLDKQVIEDGRLMHANMEMNGALFMLCDEFPEHATDTHAPSSGSGSASTTVHVNLEKPQLVDRAVAKAVKAGAVVTMPVADMFWGMRYGRLRDPFGHVWSFGAPLPGKT